MKKTTILLLFIFLSVFYSQAQQTITADGSLTELPQKLLSLRGISKAPDNPIYYGNSISEQAKPGVTASCSEENPNDFTFEDGFYCSSISSYKTANDLNVAAGENFTLTGITASIFVNGPIANVEVIYYENASGRPGAVIGSQSSATIASQNVIGNNLGFDVREVVMNVNPFFFAGQANRPTKYWIQLSVTAVNATKNVFWVITSSSSAGSNTAQYDNKWTLPDLVDGVYKWAGTCDVIPGGNPIYCSESNPNDFLFPDGFNCSANGGYRAANDLNVGPNEDFALKYIKATLMANGGISNVRVNYYSDASGIPGTLIGSEASATINSQVVIGTKSGYDVSEITLSVNPFLFAGQQGAPKKYWIELAVTDGGATPNVYWASSGTKVTGSPMASGIRGGVSKNAWEIVNIDVDGIYEWEGDCIPSGTGSFFPSPYCGPLFFPQNVEPITNVSVAGINNVSDIYSVNPISHEDFTSIKGTMERGESYDIVLEGYTGGGFNSNFVVFIDWNQNGILGDVGEVYAIPGSLINSSGFDGQQLVGTISVPSNAVLGETRMRVKKISGMGNISNPCQASAYGQAEDYTIEVRSAHVDYVYENGIWIPQNPEGLSTSLDNIQIKNGSALFSSAVAADNLIIDSGASLEVGAVLDISGNLTNNGELTFLSGPTGHGELGPLSNSSIVSGQATVQLYSSYNRAYRMATSAVTTTTSIHHNWQEGAISNTDDPHPGFGTHITGSKIDQANGFDGTSTGTSSMYTANEAIQQFVSVPNTDMDIFEAGSPYLIFVRGDRSINLNDNFAAGETILRAKGTLHKGDKSTIFNTVNAGDFAMFGNPYQSAIDVNKVFVGSSNVNPSHYYVYDPTQGDFGVYVTVNLPSGTNSGTSTANNYLQPGQGAQFATMNAGPSEILIREMSKAPGNSTTTHIANNTLVSTNMLTVQLFEAENFRYAGPVHDSFAIVFDVANENSLTPKDAVKPLNFYENLAIEHNDILLSMEYRELPKPDEVFKLYSSGYTHSSYVIKCIVDGLKDSFLYLEDKWTGATILLEKGETTYSFVVDAEDPNSVATDRFEIRVGNRLTTDPFALLDQMHLYPNPLTVDTFYVSAPAIEGMAVNVKISDVSGRLLFEEAIRSTDGVIEVNPNGDLSSGIYLVTLKLKDKTKVFRLVKE